jgi:gamma-glutamyltranspeptidase/glutathione hydrolase
MAAAGHYLATQAALQILEAGGNAVDAGVAGGIALGVVQCEYVGFGGVAPIMVRLAGSGEVHTITGLGHWPRLADVELLRREHAGRIPPGLLRTVVPAAPDAWITALERWGTMSYAEVAGSALRFARDGFPAPSLMCDIIARSEDGYRRWPENERLFLPDGRAPRTGELFVQSDLARTMQYMMDEEQAAAATGGRDAGLRAVREAFYLGDIAQTMVAYHEANGGWLRSDDLASFRVQVLAPIEVTLGDLQVYTCGPWCQGPVLAQTLELLQPMAPWQHPHNSADYIHLLVEAFKLAFSDRHHYLGDPDFVDVPVDRLLAEPYLQARRATIDPERACPGMPAAGDAAALGLSPPQAAPAATGPGDERAQIDTSYVSVVDGQGNMFSATPSDGSASAPVIPGLGFVPSSRGVQSWTDPDVPAVLAPGKRPRLTPNPAMAIKSGRHMLSFGSPGNDVQCQAMLQVLYNVFEYGMTLQQAIEQPRFASFSYPRSSDPHPYSPGLLNLEARIDTGTGDSLATMGHDVRWWPEWEYAAGAVCAVMLDRESGLLEGAADPRRPGAAAGW